MAENRIRGQEVSIRISKGSIVQDTITAIDELSISFDFATISEGYLGERTVRQDDIFNGISGSFTVTPEGQEVLTLIDAIKSRAQRKTSPNADKINLVARFSFPNGQTPKMLLQDLKFDAVSFNTSARDAYVKSPFSFKCADGKVIST